MKGTQVLLILLLALLAGGFIYWLLVANNNEINSIESPKSFSETHTNLVAADKQIKKAKLELSEENQDEVLLSEAESCEELNRLCPECEPEFNQLMTDIFINFEGLGGAGPYATMPIESLVSLAQAKDTSAMLVQGTDLLWQAAVGVRIMNRPKQYSNAEVRTIIERHKIDFGQFEEGERLLYQAATLGRFGALMELVQIHGLLQRQLVKKAYDGEVIEDTLVKKWAYQKLFKAIHKHDPVLQATIDYQQLNQKDKELLGSLNPDKSDSDIQALFNELQLRSERQFAKLEQDWTHDREYQGAVIFPKLMSERLALYSQQAQKLCWNPS